MEVHWYKTVQSSTWIINKANAQTYILERVTCLDLNAGSWTGVEPILNNALSRAVFGETLGTSYVFTRTEPWQRIPSQSPHRPAIPCAWTRHTKRTVTFPFPCLHLHANRRWDVHCVLHAQQALQLGCRRRGAHHVCCLCAVDRKVSFPVLYLVCWSENGIVK